MTNLAAERSGVGMRKRSRRMKGGTRRRKPFRRACRSLYVWTRVGFGSAGAAAAGDGVE
jgi:hypothetical protein